ncbi:MAG TPA: GTP cyclohydrolase II [Stellaceae bacterium]|nr:GTP cyclohydrolase II [Stellaceae bacterium]
MKRHIILTSHPTAGRTPPPMHWGASTASERGPLIASSAKDRRNVIGAHAGAFAIYRALAITAGKLSPIHVPDLTNTTPVEKIGPHPQWASVDKIVSLDPWGHLVADVFAGQLAEGWDIRPTIAITKAHIQMPELRQAIDAGRLRPDGSILLKSGAVRVTKAAIEPVWFLPGIAERFGVSESDLRRGLFEYTGGMFAELVTRPDLKVFLPPIGGITIYCIGDLAAIPDPTRKLACRVHDECNGSDVFGSDICTCRPYLAHGIEVCVATAQEGGAGLVVYNRKEGRALGEVTKFLVYNARKRQEGGDQASTYFERTECVAGVQDARFQQLMPDPIHWLGLRRLDRFISMSDMKHDALESQGIEIVERVPIPDELVPPDAHVEINAKRAAGYYAPEPRPLTDPLGRALENY